MKKFTIRGLITAFMLIATVGSVHAATFTVSSPLVNLGGSIWQLSMSFSQLANGNPNATTSNQMVVVNFGNGSTLSPREDVVQVTVSDGLTFVTRNVSFETSYFSSASGEFSGSFRLMNAADFDFGYVVFTLNEASGAAVGSNPQTLANGDISGTASLDPAPVPLPATGGLMMVGLMGLGFWRKRKQKTA